MNRRHSDEASTLAEPVAPQASTAWRFGAFRFDARRGELTRSDGAPIALRPKTEQLLRQFLAKPGERLGREELMAALWPHTFVTDDSLVQCVSELRAALDDHEQRLIRTLPRRGYRFEGSVRPVEPSGPLQPSAPVEPPAAVASPSRPEAEAPRAVGEAPDPRARARSAMSRALRSPALVIACAVLVVFAAAWLLWRSASVAPPLRIDEAMAERHVTAVLPFTATPDEPRLRDIADRVADEIGSQIAMDTSMRAIGRRRTETLSAVDRSPSHLARLLKASYAVTGRVATAAGASGASVDVQVLSLPGGAVIGTARFEVETSAEAATAGDIGQLVTNLVRAKQGALEAARASAPGHVPDAVELAILGSEAIPRMGGVEEMLRARGRFQEALRHDPESLIALGGLAGTYTQGKWQFPSSFGPNDAAALEATLAKGMRINPNDPTITVLWAIQRASEGRPDLAIPAFEKSIRILPSPPGPHLSYGLALIRVARLDEATAALERTLRLALLNDDQRRASTACLGLAEIAVMQGADARAAELARRSIALGPHWRFGITAYAVLAAAEALSGNERQAAADMAVYRERAPTATAPATVSTYDARQPSSNPAFLALRERLYEGLRRAGLPER